MSGVPEVLLWPAVHPGHVPPLLSELGIPVPGMRIELCVNCGKPIPKASYIVSYCPECFRAWLKQRRLHRPDQQADYFRKKCKVLLPPKCR